MRDHHDPEADLHPPSAERVLRRALALSGVVCRGFLEQDEGDADAERFRERICSWLKEHDTWSELEPDEANLLGTTLGSAASQAVVNATWRTEGLLLLAWALGRHDSLPGPDVSVDPKAMTDAVGFLGPSTDPAPSLRSSAELKAMGDRCFAVHWRLRQFRLDRAPLDFATFARTAWFGPLDIADLALVDGDLSIDDVAIANADARAVQRCMSIAQERHKAINWLLGYDEVYSQVDTST